MNTLLLCSLLFLMLMPTIIILNLIWHIMRDDVKWTKEFIEEKTIKPKNKVLKENNGHFYHKVDFEYQGETHSIKTPIDHKNLTVKVYNYSVLHKFKNYSPLIERLLVWGEYFGEELEYNQRKQQYKTIFTKDFLFELS